MSVINNLAHKIWKNNQYGKLSSSGGGGSTVYNNSPFIFKIAPEQKAVRYYCRNSAWWAVEFDCKVIGDWDILRNKIAEWNCANSKIGLHHFPRYTNYVGFRREEDAMMCFLAFA